MSKTAAAKTKLLQEGIAKETTTPCTRAREEEDEEEEDNGIRSYNWVGSRRNKNLIWLTTSSVFSTLFAPTWSDLFCSENLTNNNCEETLKQVVANTYLI